VAAADTAGAPASRETAPGALPSPEPGRAPAGTPPPAGQGPVTGAAPDVAGAGPFAARAPGADPDRRPYELALVALLVGASAVCVVLLGARMVYSDGTHYSFLLWNLFLAWVPLGFAALARALAATRRVVSYLAIVLSAFVWLLFFPNAPYILTDFLHLGSMGDTVPGWYDVMMLTWFAWTGLLLGVASLRLVQEIVARVLGRAGGWVFVVVVALLGSLGIYVGRFLRWNSWDAFRDPLSKADEIWSSVSDPMANPRMVVFTALFALLFLFIYVALHVYAGLVREGAPAARARRAGRG